jgi:polyisoprenoid-binding protein YceI
MRTLAIALFIAAAPAVAHAADYDIDPSHSAASFTVKHMMISNVRGELSGLKGTVSWTKPDFSDAKIDVTIDATTIDTREPNRDKHLKSPDFFDVAKFPTLSFKSTKVTKQGDKVKIAGDLTMHGVTKPVTFEGTAPTKEMKDPWGNVRVAATATTKVNRKDYGLNWNKALEAGGVLVGDEVTIEISLELIKKAEQKKAER